MLRSACAALLLASPTAALLISAGRSTAGRAHASTIMASFDAPVVMGTEEMMADKGKGHGTSPVPIQKDLVLPHETVRWCHPFSRVIFGATASRSRLQ